MNSSNLTNSTNTTANS